MYATQQSVQWSQIWFKKIVKVKMAIIFDGIMIFKFCKRYLVNKWCLPSA